MAYFDQTTRGGLPIRKRVRFSNDLLFKDENDHNPIVAATCPKCNGVGQWGAYQRVGESLSHMSFRCDLCEGLGAIDEPVRMFTDEPPPAKVQANSSGWVTCPNCHKRFSTRHRDTWTGWRHHCGQRLIVEQAPAPSENP